MDVFMGLIQPFGFNFAPRGWATCSGQLIAIQQNSALFSLLGTYYGGNGTSNFALPDLRGRVAVGQGQGPGLSPYTIGEVTGTETTTLTSQQMPMHNHMMTVTSAAATASAPSGSELIGAPNGEDSNLGAVTVKMYAPAGGAQVQLAPQTIGMSGGSQPFSVLQPLLCINYSIALQGIFPSRN